MELENGNFLIKGAEVFGVDLNGKVVRAFDLYLRELLKWNRKVNLTAIRTEKGIVLEHFLDYLSANPYLSGTSTLLDVGSGAGFPGIPLKIVNPGLGVTLIDSVQKKVDFQNHIIRTLHLKGIDTIHGRVQDLEVIERLGGRFDVVISRENAVRILRRALMRLAGLSNGSGRLRPDEGPTESLLPYGRDRKAWLREHWGDSVPLHRADLPARTLTRRGRVQVYLDVSGSMDGVIRPLYAALASLAPWLAPEVQLFSTGVTGGPIARAQGGPRDHLGHRHSLRHRAHSQEKD